MEKPCRHFKYLFFFFNEKPHLFISSFHFPSEQAVEAALSHAPAPGLSISFTFCVRKAGSAKAKTTAGATKAARIFQAGGPPIFPACVHGDAVKAQHPVGISRKSVPISCHTQAIGHAVIEEGIPRQLAGPMGKRLRGQGPWLFFDPCKCKLDFLF